MPVQTPSTSFDSTRLLVDLVTNTLDPGYAAAAARRGGRPSRRWYDRPAVAIGCALIGFTLVVAYVHTHRGAPASEKVHDSLVARVRTAQAADKTLSKHVEQLTGQLTALRNQALPGTLTDQINRDELAAGQTAVSGPGIVVTLKEPQRQSASSAAGRGGSTPITATNILTDRDVRSVVNELWADGAEAISVNNIRLTPTSAVRFAGDAVLVDFQPIQAPFAIRAIGKPNDLITTFASSEVASRYQTLVSADGIAFDFNESNSLRLPASSPVSLQYAHVVNPSPTGTTR